VYPASFDYHAPAALDEALGLAWRHTGVDTPASPAERHGWESPAPVACPVCGMDVAIVEATETAEVAGVLYYFCGAGCRRRFEADPASYLTEVNRT